MYILVSKKADVLALTRATKAARRVNGQKGAQNLIVTAFTDEPDLDERRKVTLSLQVAPRTGIVTMHEPIRQPISLTYVPKIGTVEDHRPAHYRFEFDDSKDAGPLAEFLECTEPVIERVHEPAA